MTPCIALRNWRYHSFIFGLQGIESRGATYVFYCDGVVTYIGQSGNVKKRIGQYSIRMEDHGLIVTPWGVFRSVVVKVRYGRRFGEWAMRELRLIRRLQPRGNSVGLLKEKISA